MNDVHIEQPHPHPQQMESQVEQQVKSQPQQQINELKRSREDDTNVPVIGENQNNDDMRQPDEKKIKLNAESTASETAPTIAPVPESAPTAISALAPTPTTAPVSVPAPTTTPAPATTPAQDLNSSVKVESTEKKAKGRLALLERLKGAVRKTEDILESAASPVPVTTTPPTKKSSRSRKSKGVEDQEEFEPESRQQTPASASRERRSRRSRKSTNYGADDPYEMADTITKLLVGPFRTCYEILQQVKKHPWAWPFAQPVDVEGLGIPDYLIIIKNPMDLGTVQQKLTTGQYPTVYDFANDMRLIWHNCKLYNQPGSDVVKMAEALQTVFEEKFKKVVDEVESPNNASAKMREMQAQMREMQAKIDNLSSTPPNGQYQLENLPPGMIATPAQPIQPSSSRARSGRGGRKSVGSARGSRKSQQQPVVDSRPMTFEEKKELSELIGKLNNDQLARVVEIIQLHAPRDDYASQTETEIEIDLDQLDAVTLRELERFSKESLGLIKTRRKPGPKPGSKRKPAAKRSSLAGRGGKENSDSTYETTLTQQQQQQQSQSQSQPQLQHQQQPHQQSHDTDEETDDDSDTSTDSSGDELDSDSDDDQKNRPQSLSSTQGMLP